MRTVLHQILVSRGYRVLQASSGEEGLVISRLHRGAIHLLLTDVTMPRDEGDGARPAPARRAPADAGVFMSGYNDELLSDGGAASPLCLQKPFSPRTLGETLRTILDQADGELRATG